MKNIYEFIAREFGARDSVNIVEVGAHIGTDTVQLAKFVGKGKMVSFEPDPRNIPILKKRIEENGLKIQLVEKAIGDKVGNAEFYLSSGIPPYDDDHIAETKQHTASSSLKAPKNHLERFPWVKFDDVHPVSVTSLDAFFGISLAEPDRTSLNGFPEGTIDILWVDVQGAEFDLIVGGTKVLAQTKFLFTEFNNDEMYEGQANLDKLLASLPGDWGLVHIFGDEILLQNKAFGDDWTSDSHAQQCWDERYATPSMLPVILQQGQILARDFFIQASQNHSFSNLLKSSKSMFEIGCGTGELAHIAKQSGIEKVLATDCSKVAIAYASGQYGNEAEFKVHDARTPWKRGEFDMSIASNVLQLFKNPFLLVDNMLKVSKYCVVTVPYMQPVTDGYDDEGGVGHVFSFTDSTFEKYDIINQMHYVTLGWQHSAKGEPPLMMSLLIRRR